MCNSFIEISTWVEDVSVDSVTFLLLVYTFWNFSIEICKVRNKIYQLCLFVFCYLLSTFPLWPLLSHFAYFFCCKYYTFPLLFFVIYLNWHWGKVRYEPPQHNPNDSQGPPPDTPPGTTFGTLFSTAFDIPFGKACGTGTSSASTVHSTLENFLPFPSTQPAHDSFGSLPSPETASRDPTLMTTFFKFCDPPTTTQMDKSGSTQTGNSGSTLDSSSTASGPSTATSTPANHRSKSPSTWNRTKGGNRKSPSKGIMVSSCGRYNMRSRDGNGKAIITKRR